MQTLKIVMLGTAGVGKSSLTMRMISGNFMESYDPTIENRYRVEVDLRNRHSSEPLHRNNSTIFLNSQDEQNQINQETSWMNRSQSVMAQYPNQDSRQTNRVILEITDTAGVEDFQLLRDQHILAGEGYMLVYSVTNRQSFEGIREIFKHILEVREEDQHDFDIPIILVANKVDILTGSHHTEKVSRHEGRQLAQELKISFFETSAKIGLNVEDEFLYLAERISVHKRRKRYENVSSSEINTKSGLSRSSSRVRNVFSFQRGSLSRFIPRRFRFFCSA